jgi:hypothetical protein
MQNALGARERARADLLVDIELRQLTLDRVGDLERGLGQPLRPLRADPHDKLAKQLAVEVRRLRRHGAHSVPGGWRRV